MEAKSSILFITLGSLNQVDGGSLDYDVQNSIQSMISADLRKILIETRAASYKWLKEDKDALWQGIRLADHKHNKNLQRGPDFGSRNVGARYRPALDRFVGGFFQTLGDTGKEVFRQSQHHILLVCGLYGLSNILEPVQLYNCPVEIGLPNFKLWTEHDALTDVLIDYIQQHRISRVFDLTATEPRRKLISWTKIRNNLPNNVVHCFSTAAAGDHALIPFAKLMKQVLLSASPAELLDIQPETEIEDVVFRYVDKPRFGMPIELEIASRNLEDDLGRKRRGIIRFLDKAESGHKERSEQLGERVERMLLAKKIDQQMADDMWQIIRLRNKVEYEQYQPGERELHSANEAWKRLRSRAQWHNWKIDEFE